jgi:hypothetical protein
MLQRTALKGSTSSELMSPWLSLFFIRQDLPGLPMALRVSGRLTVLPMS